MAVDRKDLTLANGQRQPKRSTGSSGIEWQERRRKEHERRTFKHEALSSALAAFLPFKAGA